MRIRTPTAAFNDQPFTGAGVSLYVTIGTEIVYRYLRVVGGRRRGRNGWIKGSGAVRGFGSGVNKTARVSSAADPTAQIVYALPAALASQVVTFDVRRYDTNVENENDGFHTVTVTLDANRDAVSTINATAEVLSQEIREGGVVRLFLRVYETLDGTQPILVRATRTAGPSSPADATATYTAGQSVVEIDTPALLDSSAYTYTIRLENGAVTKSVVTGLSVTADATGPAVPQFVTAETR